MSTGLIRSLDPAECRALLELDDVGRVAVVQGEVPAIFPVNYVVDGDAIVFRTDPGTKLTHGAHRLVAFEVDGLDRERRRGWSVVAVGPLEEVGPFDEEAHRRLAALPIHPWAGGEKGHLLRLVPGLLSGREVGTPDG